MASRERLADSIIAGRVPSDPNLIYGTTGRRLPLPQIWVGWTDNLTVPIMFRPSEKGVRFEDHRGLFDIVSGNESVNYLRKDRHGAAGTMARVCP